ncbi:MULTISPECIES: amidohydrolase [unclassified Ruegeria]|uniref:amidohydrolase family protein n=1 Tax=unclassified Ruegeria TaxID=2625375 RepID=UPI001489C5C5|nr:MULTISPECIES: amidohydrolase family protein [unclassified Ruegeria]NOD77626.1 amidohydrolase family protein [Ruegeria sp. HKCCD4332]NOD89830.1 amidohydrolase family protein [Ruegeria sp. HKCCD4318]NOE14724.1 amidohydrolase family protein [Ruegeria sp. HKCCD4318-2]NOG10922.1 amidohydrolase family protein [Ruegeria sp. HKCCD4315]
MKIDAHQHFWALARGDYGWLTPDLDAIYRDFTPDDLIPLLKAAEIDGTVLVQAAPTVAETEYMLALADQHAFIKGVVGWVDFEAADVDAQIAALAVHPALVGLRPMIQDIADPLWMLGDGLTPAFEAVQQYDLTFDALTLPQHLVPLRQLLQRHPDMSAVMDHGSKPLIKDAILDGWSEDMSTLARETSAWCKLSGLVTEASTDWTVEDLRPYVDHLLNTFGPSRLIWGSDWPVCKLASSYERWCETTDTLLNQLNSTERQAIMGGNAARAYNLRD